MKTLICIPAMDMVQTLFMQSLVSLKKPEGTEVAICSSSLIYDARNKLAERAVKGGYDRVLWLDSDMLFEDDLLYRLSAKIDEGRDIVAGLFFTRKAPVHPCVYKRCEMVLHEGVYFPTIEPAEYGEDIFEAAACGFGAVMMTGDVLQKVMERDMPFSPLPGFGEDFSFCLRARDLGAKIWCDPTIRVGHIGICVFDEGVYLALKEAKK